MGANRAIATIATTKCAVLCSSLASMEDQIVPEISLLRASKRVLPPIGGPARRSIRHGISGTPHGTSGTETRPNGHAPQGISGTQRRYYGNDSLFPTLLDSVSRAASAHRLTSYPLYYRNKRRLRPFLSL